MKMIRREFLSIVKNSAAGLFFEGSFELEMQQRAARVIREYDMQGFHRTGTQADNLSGRWLAGLVREYGLKPSQGSFSLRRVDPQTGFLLIGNIRIEGLPVFDGGFTKNNGIVGQIGPLGSGTEIGLVEMPPNAEYGPNYEKMRRESKHRAIVLVTRGSRPGLCPINASSFNNPYGLPILQVSSVESGWLKQQAEKKAGAKIVVSAKRTGVRAFNVIARIKGSDPKLAPLVLMTPRSAWWQCASERGGGLVCWLEAMRALAKSKPDRDCLFVATSGHEIGHLGLDAFIDDNRNLVKNARLWIHFGANIGAALEPGHRLQTSDDELEKISVEAMEQAGAKIDEKVPPGTVPVGESGNIHRGGGRYISVVGRNALFHNPADRWPNSVDLSTVSKFAAAFVQIALNAARI